VTDTTKQRRRERALALQHRNLQVLSTFSSGKGGSLCRWMTASSTALVVMLLASNAIASSLNQHKVRVVVVVEVGYRRHFNRGMLVCCEVGTLQAYVMAASIMSSKLCAIRHSQQNSHNPESDEGASR
jgi:hypothetical protein